MSDLERKIPVGDHEPVIRRSVGELTEREDGPVIRKSIGAPTEREGGPVMRRVIGAAPVSRPAKTQPITELYSKGERKRAPVSSPPGPDEITVLSYEDNSPRLFDPLSIVLSVLGTSIIFVLLWMMR